MLNSAEHEILLINVKMPSIVGIFSSPETKAPRSAISIPVTPSSVVHRPSVLPSTFSKIFSSETTGPIELKFHMETPKDGGTKVCSNGPGHMTKMVTMPIYGKNHLKIFFSRTRWPMTLGLGMFHRGCRAYQICSNDEPRLTLTYFTSRSNLLPNAFKWEIFEKLIFRKLLKPKSLFSLDMFNLMQQWL